MLCNNSSEKYAVVTSEFLTTIITRPDSTDNRFMLFVKCESCTNNYFKLLKEKVELKDAIKIYVNEMKKIFDEENIKNYIIWNK